MWRGWIKVVSFGTEQRGVVTSYQFFELRFSVNQPIVAIPSLERLKLS